jgi:hypothetical protein
MRHGPGVAENVLGRTTVKFTAIATIATAAALSLGMAASASAAPLGLRSAAAPQVTGTRLQSALLPASAFGSGFTAANRLNTGKKLWSTRTRLKPSNLSCKNFEMYIYVGGFGDTAGANVYTIDNLDGTNDPISASLLGSLMNRVQALYKHH